MKIVVKWLLNYGPLACVCCENLTIFGDPNLEFKGELGALTTIWRASLRALKLALIKEGTLNARKCKSGKDWDSRRDIGIQSTWKLIALHSKLSFCLNFSNGIIANLPLQLTFLKKVTMKDWAQSSKMKRFIAIKNFSPKLMHLNLRAIKYHLTTLL